MKIKDGFILREIADTIVVVPTGDLTKEFNGVVNLNKTGKFIWELLKDEMTEEDIAKKLVETYNISYEKAIESTQKFVKQLKEINALED